MRVSRREGRFVSAIAPIGKYDNQKFWKFLSSTHAENRYQSENRNHRGIQLVMNQQCKSGKKDAKRFAETVENRRPRCPFEQSLRSTLAREESAKSRFRSREFVTLNVSQYKAMPSVNMRQLRDTRRLKSWLRAGKTVELKERDRVIARIVPETNQQSPVKWPDFDALAKEILGDRVLPGSDLLVEERGRY